MTASAALSMCLTLFRIWFWQPTQVSFQLSGVAGAAQTRTVLTRNGVAWTKMNSAAKEGAAQFIAQVGNAAGKRVIQQVPGRSVRP